MRTEDCIGNSACSVDHAPPQKSRLHVVGLFPGRGIHLDSRTSTKYPPCESVTLGNPEHFSSSCTAEHSVQSATDAAASNLFPDALAKASQIRHRSLFGSTELPLGGTSPQKRGHARDLRRTPASNGRRRVLSNA